MTEADVPALAGLLARAYPEGDPPRMARRLKAALAFGPVQSFVAEEEGRPAGMVLANDYRTTSYIALMGVEPERQRRGIGQALMGALVAWLDQRRLPAELMATPAGRGLYLRYGFVDTGEGEVWYGRASSASGEGLSERRDEATIRALDREAFGAERRGALSALFAEGENAFFVAGQGYAVAQRSPGVLGPVVAPDAATAGRLLCAASSALGPGEHRVNAASRGEVRDLLRSLGYRRDRSLHRMVRGAPPPGSRKRIWVLLNLGQG